MGREVFGFCVVGFGRVWSGGVECGVCGVDEVVPGPVAGWSEPLSAAGVDDVSGDGGDAWSWSFGFPAACGCVLVEGEGLGPGE